MCKILEVNKGLPEPRLITSLRKWASENNEFFLQWIDPTGEITNEDAGRRYVNFSKELGLVTSKGNNVVNTIYGTILSKFDEPRQNPYKLTCGSKCFLLKRLLEEDFDYLTTLASLFVNKAISFIDFRKSLAAHLKRSSTLGMLARDMRLLREMEEEWKSPKKYFREHILAPRKGWLLDLELADWNKFESSSRIEFKLEARDFFVNVEKLERSQLSEYLANEYYEEIATLLGNGTKIDSLSHLPKERKREKTLGYLKKSFSIFGTAFLNRISSRSFFEYVPCYALCDEKLICPRRDLEEMLLEISASTKEGYRYRRVEEMSEDGRKIDVGYITGKT